MNKSNTHPTSTTGRRCLVRGHGSRTSTQGTALIIVLSFVALLTIIVIAFLSQSTTSRQIFNARAGQTQVDVLANSAIQFMKADLRQEIISGSTTYYGTNSLGVAVQPVYIPTNNATGILYPTIVPSRTGFTPGTTATADPYANIVKISKYSTNFFPATANYNISTYPATNYVSQSSTGDAALNGRFIDSTNTGWTTNGWDKPQLIDTTAYPTALANVPLPDWIYVTSSGRKIISAPESDVVGRYAFVVYDEGGLLDINSAGYNTALSTADAYDVARKGSLGLADLTQIPGITTTIRDALIAWRNNVTSTSSSLANAVPASTTTNYVFTNSTPNAYPPTNSPTTAPPYLQYLVDGGLNNGFLKTYPGDQKFLSRQDLLASQAAGTIGLTTQSLAYLGTFTRTINAPTWTPIDSPGETFTPTTTYAANAENFSWGVPSTSWLPVYNRDIPNVRWPAKVTIKRPALNDECGSTGTSVQVETVSFNQGDPVVQHRFPLSKLALLANPLAKTSNPATAGTVAWAVLYYFGMEWNSSGNTSVNTATNPAYYEPHWEYYHCRNNDPGDTSTGGIKYACAISEVASGTATEDHVFGANREPDFFEMLQAGILRGSISELNLFDLGLCAIDQTTPTDVPDLMCLATGGANRQWMGRKNLPYFCQMLFWPYRPTSWPGEADNYRDTIEAYLIPMLWNPHRNASTEPVTVTNLRMYLFYSHGGSIWTTLTPASGGFSSLNAGTGYDYNQTTPDYAASNVPSTLPNPVPASLSNYIITFNNSSDFSEPTILSGKYVTSPAPTDPNTGSPVGGLTQTPNSRWGFFLGSASIPDSKVATLTGQNLSHIPVPWSGTPTTWPATTTVTLTGISSPSTGTGVSYRLQCEDASGVWHSYADTSAVTWDPAVQAVDTIGASLNITSATYYNGSPCFSGLNAGGDAYDYVGAISFGPLDPRINVVVNPTANLLGTGSLWITSIGGSSITAPPIGATIRPYPNASTQQSQIIQRTSPNNNTSTAWGLPSTFTTAWGLPPTFNGTGNYPGMYSENNPALPSPAHILSYADNGGGSVAFGITGDGVTRPGDGFNGAYPMATVADGGNANGQDRPIILNRPFLSVGELGYTFRSLEWKTIDFSSAQSGDSGLLDLFSINDTENANQQAMISGVVNLNTHNPAVLQALISGGLINGLDTTGSGITTADAQTMANAIVAETNGQGTGAQAGPLLNRAQLATRVASLKDIKTALTTDGYLTKDRREAVVRALAEPADTRTWNLLIDLVAQAGRYPTSATALSQFDVQGERHFWLHLAIDRYTGKVIDEQLEVVHDN